ncbi:holo-ACP synthase [Macrococcus capreoli]|uniref:holo-ACP synthase n=1 Tax=Macrococcus capreoli TaxID=2982690 RepID=UPI0021D5FD04|nr:holo-ACP synthase [Macrococcus sp. TMW 2.2395]MCU7558079.1 holo-ACP synthase [Macrococcus sp. TMW 2.2395]
MIKGIGTDIIEIARIQKSLENPKLITRILHPKEIERFESFTSEKRRAEYFAGRFCVKEAYSKALGTGIGQLNFNDICCLNDAAGKPYIEGVNAHVSIAHSDTVATAYVIIEE